MLTIRAEQIEAFEQAARPGAIKKLTAWLRERYSPAELGDGLDRRVERTVVEAEGHGLISRADIYSYTELRLVHAFAIHNDPDLRDVCGDEGVSKTTRMLNFLLRKPPSFWQESRLYALRAARGNSS